MPLATLFCRICSVMTTVLHVTVVGPRPVSTRPCHLAADFFRPVVAAEGRAVNHWGQGKKMEEKRKMTELARRHALGLLSYEQISFLAIFGFRTYNQSYQGTVRMENQGKNVRQLKWNLTVYYFVDIACRSWLWCVYHGTPVNMRIIHHTKNNLGTHSLLTLQCILIASEILIYTIPAVGIHQIASYPTHFMAISFIPVPLRSFLRAMFLVSLLRIWGVFVEPVCFLVILAKSRYAIPKGSRVSSSMYGLEVSLIWF